MSARDAGNILESFTFRPGSETYLARYDQVETSASMAVVATLAEILEADPTEMDPLFHSVDIESLDALFRGGTDGDVRVTSRIAGHDVTVTVDSVIASRAINDGGTVGVMEVSPT